MSEPSITELTELGLAAGRQLGGTAVRKLLVEPGDTWTGDPLYHFWYQLDTKVLPPGQGRLLGDLTLKLIHELYFRGDETFPLVHFWSEEEWNEAGRA